MRLSTAKHLRQRRGIELIASENFVSDEVMRAMGSCLTNKYAEGYPAKRYYGGCQVVDEAENLAIERAKKLFGAEWANVQPHSGAQANMAVFMAVLQPGDKFMGMDLSHGGHLSHGSPVNFSGLMFNPISYTVEAETGRVNYEEMEEKARAERPKLIIAGASAYSREWDYARIRKIADEIGAIFMVDMAHPAGLIACRSSRKSREACPHRHHNHPQDSPAVRAADSFLWARTSTIPGVRKLPKGEIKKMSALLDSAVFPGVQGGPLEHVIAAKAVAFGEALQPEWKEYAVQVKKNANALANALINRGYKIISDGTDNHCMLV